MKGCLSIIIKTVIAVLVFFGLVYIGAVDFIKEKINEKTNPPQEELIDKTKDIVDLSEIDEEYTIDKNLKILKNRMIIAEHNASGQKMIIIEPRKENIITKEDIESDDFQEKLENILKKYKYQLIKFNKIETEKKGKFEGLSQEIPYTKVKVEIANLPVKDMEGIIGIAELDNGKNLIIISANEKGKYSQIVTEAFFKKVNKCKNNTKD